MKTFNHTFHWLATMLAVVATLTAACSDDIESIMHQQSAGLAADTATHVYQLHFDCRQPSFDTLTTRAATSWPDGAIVYLRLAGNYSYDAYYGQAVYSSSTGKWTLSVTGSVPLTETSTRSCKAYYFVNPVTVGSTNVTLNEQTAVYEATGTYTHPTSSEFYVTMTLKPATWRLSFKGTNNSTAFTLPAGTANTISWPSNYNRSTGELTWTTTQNIGLTTNRSNYSPYVYGKFTNSSTNTITVSYDTDEAYQRTFVASRLAIGESGYFTLPSSSNYSSLGWSLAMIQESLSPSSWTSTNKGNNSTGYKTWTITASAGDVLSFDYSVSSEDGYDKLNVRLSGALSYTLVNGVSGSISNRTVTYTFTKTGTYTLRAEYVKDNSRSSGDDRAVVSNLKIMRSSPPAETLTPSSWTSTNKGDNSTGYKTWSITASVGDVLSFSYSVSSEAGYDKLNVRLSGALSYTLVDGASGFITNREVRYSFTKSGTYTLRAEYVKDGSASSGNDQASLTNLIIERH